MAQKDILDVDIILASVADGPHAFVVDGRYQSTELNYLAFKDANGAVVTPSAGTVEFQVCCDGINWETVDGGLFSATVRPNFPPFHVGKSTGGRLIFTGIVGAVSAKLSLRNSNAPVQDPRDLLTSDVRGVRRVRVDDQRASFYEGREFRTFIPFSLSNGQALYLKFTCPVDFILRDERIALNDGEAYCTAYRTVSAVSGTWTARPSIGCNTMNSRPSPFYVSAGVLSSGGTYTVNSADEVGPPMNPKTPTNNAQQRTTLTSNDVDRGLAAGTYYIKIAAVGNAATGIYYLEWEEVPA